MDDYVFYSEYIYSDRIRTVDPPDTHAFKESECVGIL